VGAIEIGSLRAAEIADAAALISCAFQDDPVIVYLFPDSGERLRLAPLMFAAMTRYDYLFGQVDRLGNIAAIATWLRPGEGEETAERLIQAGFDELLGQMDVPLQRLAHLDRVVEETRRQAAPDPHWYLRLLAVDPAQQGAGLGSWLLEHGVARAAATGHPCYLETFNKRSVGYYLRHGFDIVADSVAPVDGIQFWGLRRSTVV
jgi:GNAT superfamily N-acetyltransferase